METDLGKVERAGKVSRNIAVVGCGYWGKNLVRNFAELGALHTICDSNSEVMSKLAPLYPDINTETSFEEILTNKEIKGVVVSSPAALHYSMAKQALQANKDIFVEKPLSLTVQEGEELVKLAEEKRKVLMVGHVLEYHPGVIKLKQMVDDGELGKIDYIYSSRLNLGKFRTEENILWSFAPHDISVILLLLNELPVEVSAHGGCYLHQNIADVTVTTMSFASGVRAHIFVSWIHPYKEQKLVVVGDKKMAVFDDVAPQNKLLLYEHGIEWVDRMPVPRKQETTPVKFDMAEPLKLECQHFLKCMETRSKPKTDGESGLKVLRVLDACQRSLQGRFENIPLNSTEASFFVHPTSIVEAPSSIGEGTKIWHFCHIMPHVNIGKNCIIGQNVFIGENVNVGNNVKIQNNVSVYDGVTLEDDVFCGPSCVFTNIKSPRSRISQKGKYTPTMVGRGATIGANATIVCGNTIGQYALIGAGSVVTKDIPDYAMVYGNPASIEGWVCQCGVKLDFKNNKRTKCSQCGKEYVMKGAKGNARMERLGA
jgi:UDP-2-acetamido-3-amino-2,3-dideoxy-glucuronate N-acetyltransferase